MNKQDIAELIWQKNQDLPKARVERIVDMFVDLILDALSRGEDVKLRGLGSFRNVVVKERKGKDPQGREIIIPEHRTIKFIKPKNGKL